MEGGSPTLSSYITDKGILQSTLISVMQCKAIWKTNYMKEIPWVILQGVYSSKLDHVLEADHSGVDHFHENICSFLRLQMTYSLNLMTIHGQDNLSHITRWLVVKFHAAPPGMKEY